jgi:hypothetical protein
VGRPAAAAGRTVTDGGNHRGWSRRCGAGPHEGSAFGIDNEDKKADRADIQAPPIDPGADAWQQGKTIQIADPAGAEFELICD